MWSSSKPDDVVEVEEPRALYEDYEYEDFIIENTLNDDDKTLEENLQNVDSIMLPVLLRHSGLGNNKLNQQLDKLRELINSKKSLSEQPENYFYAQQEAQKSVENAEQQDVKSEQLDDKSSDIIRQFENEANSEGPPLVQTPDKPLEIEPVNAKEKFKQNYDALMMNSKLLKLIQNNMNIKKPLNDEMKSLSNPVQEDLPKEEENVVKIEPQIQENAAMPQQIDTDAPAASESSEKIPLPDGKPDLIDDDDFVFISDPNPQPSRERITAQEDNVSRAFEDAFRDDSGNVFIE